jgi:hypothetical protein
MAAAIRPLFRLRTASPFGIKLNTRAPLVMSQPDFDPAPTELRIHALTFRRAARAAA